MKKRVDLSTGLRRFGLVLVVVALGLSGCSRSLSLLNNVERDLNLDVPEAPLLSGGMTASSTVVRWEWEPSDGSNGNGGPYRWRLNRGSWIGPVNYTVLSPYEEEDGYIDHPGTPLSAADPTKHLAPGEYLLEVQVRSTSGNWSPSSSLTTSVVADGGSGGLGIEIWIANPANPNFTLTVPASVIRGATISVNLISVVWIDSLTWLVNGVPISGTLDGYTASTSISTLTAPLGVNRLTVLAEIDGTFYSTEAVYEVTQ